MSGIIYEARAAASPLFVAMFIGLGAWWLLQSMVALALAASHWRKGTAS